MFSKSLFWSSLFSLLFASASSARILNVPANYRAIQTAINASQTGDTVLVSPGRYREDLRLTDKSLTIASLILTTGDPAYIDSTIIDGERRRAGIYITDCADSALTIVGFTIRNCSGTGVYVSASFPLLQHLHITNCGTGDYGGGVSAISEARVRLEHALIDSCRGNVGGGLGTLMSSAILTDVEICFNQGDYGGGGIGGSSSGRIELNNVLIHHNTAQNGGGTYSSCGPTVVLTDCVVRDNQSSNMGGGCYSTGGGQYQFNFSLVYGNTSGSNGGGFASYSNPHKWHHFNNSLIGMNRAEDNLNFYFDGSSNADFHNSIVWGQYNHPINGNGDTLIFAYCDIDGGRNAVDGGYVDWREGNIDSDPLFVNIDEQDYNLSPDSPCIDAADPNSPRDRDGTRADIGPLAYLGGDAVLRGEVVDIETQRTVPNITIYASWGGETETDAEGGFRFGVPARNDSATFTLSVEVDSYLPLRQELTMARGDSLWVSLELRYAQLAILSDTIRSEVVIGSTASTVTRIGNTGNGPLAWRAVARSANGSGFEPWMTRMSLPLSQITDDDRIEGVAFDGEHFFAAGANGDDSSQVYVFDSEGSLITSFTQPTTSRYGFKDLEWDGELLWGSGDSTVYGMTADGMLQRSWRGPFNPNTNIAADPESGTLYISNITSDILAVDRNGNLLDRRISRNGYRIYGLAWFADDPDGCPLYALTTPSNDTVDYIVKTNPASNEWRVARSIPRPAGCTGIQGLAISNKFDSNGAYVIMHIAKFSRADGGSQMILNQLRPNNEWISVSPAEGSTAAGQEVELELSFKTQDEDGKWKFELGGYDGEVVYTSDGRGCKAILPIHLEIIEWSGVNAETVEVPFSNNLQPPYPNPFNGQTTIRFSVGQVSKPVRLAVYGLDGRLVEELWKGKSASPSEMSIAWNAARLPGGVYILRLESGSKFETVKAVLIK